jgi:hypothetical protein
MILTPLLYCRQHRHSPKRKKDINSALELLENPDIDSVVSAVKNASFYLHGVLMGSHRP